MSKWIWKFIGALFFIEVFAIFLIHFPKNSDEWAAWIQAIGSIGAIYYSVRIARRSDEDRQKMIQEDIVKRLRLLLATCRRITSQVRETVQGFSNYPGEILANRVIADNFLSRDIAALESISTFEMPTVDSAYGVCALIEYVKTVRTEVSSYLEKHHENAENFASYENEMKYPLERLKELVRSADFYDAMFTNFVKELGHEPDDKVWNSFQIRIGHPWGGKF